MRKDEASADICRSAITHRIWLSSAMPMRHQSTPKEHEHQLNDVQHGLVSRRGLNDRPAVLPPTWSLRASSELMAVGALHLPKGDECHNDYRVAAIYAKPHARQLRRR